MNLSEPFIRRPVMTILVMISIAFFGIVALQFLPVGDLPSTDFPTIQVSVDYPGANPETMANSVATPLEQQFMTIPGIQNIFSTSATGSTTIVLQFSLDRNIDGASTDVQAAISRAQPNLPSNLPSAPTYEKVNPAATPVLYISFTSDAMTLYDLYDYSNTFIGQRLSMVDGVAQVITYGSPYAVRIQVDPEKLAAKKIGLDEVTAAVQNANVNYPLGTLYGQRDDYTVDVDGQLLRAAGYNELIIKNANGELVKIKDIGRALDSTKNDKFAQHYITKNGDQKCIVLAIQKQPGENAVRVVQGVNKALEQLKPQLPASLAIERIYDQTDAILESMDDMKLTLAIAFCLVVGIIYLALGHALNTLIPSATLPISILGTFAVMYLFNYTADILSMLAITLSIGFLIDDAIVVLENNVRHVQQGEAPWDATLKGSREISTTIFSITVCLASAFIPMLFMSGLLGRLFREFAVTIISAILISGFVSLTLTPMLCSRFIKPYGTTKKPRMEVFSDALFEKMKRIYEPCLHWAMKRRFLMLLIGLFCIGGSVTLFITLPKDFLPPDDVGFIQCFTLARDGTSPFLMEKYQEEACELLRQDPNIDTVLSISSYANANEGFLYLRLKPFKERLPMDKAITALSEKLKTLPGINFYLSPIPLINLQVGTTAQALYQYTLSGLERDAIYSYAPKLTAQLRNDPHFTQVSSDLRIHQPQWQLHIDRDRAYNFNVSAADIENYFQYAYSDNKVSLINAPINQYQVIIETLPRFYRDPTVLSKLYVRSRTNDLVPLSELVDVKETVGPLTINHMDGLPAVTLSFNVADDYPLSTALDQIKHFTKNQLPNGVYGQVIGTADVFASSFSNLILLFLIAFFVIYAILGILYESFIHPLTVMSALPPALFGGLLTLYLFRATLSVYSFVGLILLIGIVLKNGILMIDFANEAVRNQKKTAYDAIVEASLVRFRPILMTTLAALMTGLPIALGVGGALVQTHIPLGLCMVGGLIISQILTLLLTPVLYYYFETLQERIRKWVVRNM
ncbi:MAG: efflux RND transporter permease subunit [Verrucomicrobiota bacterium]|nr:efflux RND transporter permease subunit [Verrucomicrobiota bacterium]